MSKNMKIVVIILGSVLLLCTGIAGAGFYWFSTSGKDLLKQVKSGTEKAMQEGKELGKTSDKNACVAESIQRLEVDKSFTSAFSVTLFMNACLDNAKPTPGFCDGVPAQSEIIKSSEWIAKKCKEQGVSGQGCQQLMQVVIGHCAKGASTSPTP